MATKKKGCRVDIRISESDKALLYKAAEIRRQSLSSYIIGAATKAAENDIANENIIWVSEEGMKRIVSMMENPPEPNETLKELMRGNHLDK